MAEKIKVLHLIKSLGRGGAEMLLPETLKLHDRQQFQFHYIYFLPWKDQMVGALQDAGGMVTCIPARSNLRILLQWRKVIQYARKHEIQLLHCHLPWAGFVGRMIYRMTGIPVVYSEHNKQERYHFVTRLLNRISYNYQSAVIAVSADVATSIRQNIPLRIPIYEILNGVNTDTFQRIAGAGKETKEKLGIPAGSFVVGTVAVFRFQKRLKEWLEVFAAAASTTDIHGIVVGDGPLREELLVHRKKLNLENRVHMPGLQTDVKPWLSAMDVYLMTSVFEGLPIALLEAMSMECAICTTDAGGIKEVIRDGVDGMILKSENWIDLSGCIVALAADTQKLTALKANARLRAKDKFSIATMTVHLESVYKEFAKR